MCSVSCIINIMMVVYLQTLLQGRDDSDDLSRQIPNLKVHVHVHAHVHVCTVMSGWDVGLGYWDHKWSARRIGDEVYTLYMHVHVHVHVQSVTNHTHTHTHTHTLQCLQHLLAGSRPHSLQRSAHDHWLFKDSWSLLEGSNTTCTFIYTKCTCMYVHCILPALKWLSQHIMDKNRITCSMMYRLYAWTK